MWGGVVLFLIGIWSKRVSRTSWKGKKQKGCPTREEAGTRGSHQHQALRALVQVQMGQQLRLFSVSAHQGLSAHKMGGSSRLRLSSSLVLPAARLTPLPGAVSSSFSTIPEVNIRASALFSGGINQSEQMSF